MYFNKQQLPKGIAADEINMVRVHCPEILDTIKKFET